MIQSDSWAKFQTYLIISGATLISKYYLVLFTNKRHGPRLVIGETAMGNASFSTEDETMTCEAIMLGFRGKEALLVKKRYPRKVEFHTIDELVTHIAKIRQEL